VTPEERTRLADQLAHAYETRIPISPPSETATLSVEDAYAVQSLQIERRLSSGARVRGHKIGLTSRAMQKMLGVDQPDYGHLLDAMFLPPGERVAISRFLQVRVEPEIAFVLGRDLRGPGVTPVDALRSVDFAVAALELIDSRVRDWKITLVDTIADNASSGAVVLGSRPILLRQIDPRLVGCNLYRNGSLAATGAGGAVLGDPITALVWLANTLGSLGVTLEAGEVVLSGSCTPAVPASAGDTVRADFAEFGPVSVSFEEERAA
jgi:2-keto-4-pentenoate hydratase